MHRPAVASPFAAEYLAFFRVIFFQGALFRIRPYQGMNADGSDAKEFKEQIPLLLTRGADHQIGYLAPCDAGTQAQLACIEVFGKIDTEPIDGKTKNYEYAKIKAVYSNNYKLKTTFDAPALQNAGHDGCFRMGQTA